MTPDPSLILSSTLNLNSALKLGFMGSSPFAAKALEALLQYNYNITKVYTKPPAKQSRGLKLQVSPVHDLAIQHNLPVFTPLNFKESNTVEEFKLHQFDLVIVVAYGLILPTSILQSPKLGCINIHASLLPKWRGAAPIERAIEAGDSQTGITIMQMDSGLDTGNIISSKAIPINNTTTATTLYTELQSVAILLLNQTLQDLLKLNASALPHTSTNQPQLQPLPSTPQNNDLACYAHMLKKSEGEINWQQPATVIERKIRAFNLFPSSFFYYNNERFKVHKATVIASNQNFTPGLIISCDHNLHIATAQDILSIELIQRAGKKTVTSQQLLQGFNFKVNDILT